MTTTALAAVLFSALLHAAWNALIKRSGSPFAFLYWMIAMSCVVLLPTLWLVDWRDVTPALWRWILASGVVHGFYALFLSRAYERGDLTLVYPISRSTPALVPLVAVPLLGERLTWAGACGIALVVASLWLIQAGGARVEWRRLLRYDNVYAYLTLLATVAYSMTDTTVMRLFNDLDWHGSAPAGLVFLEVQALLQLLFFTLLARRSLSRALLGERLRATWGRLLFAAVGSLGSYWLILEALRSAPVSYVVAVRQISVLFALGIGLLWLGERPSRSRLLGIAGTVAGVLMIAIGGRG